MRAIKPIKKLKILYSYTLHQIHYYNFITYDIAVQSSIYRFPRVPFPTTRMYTCYFLKHLVVYQEHPNISLPNTFVEFLKNKDIL